MQKKIEAHLRDFVSEYAIMNDTITNWESPIIGFADACGKCLCFTPCSFQNPIK